MGAYTNPPPIQLANVSEIYSRNAANINSTIQNYIQGENAKKAAASKMISESQKRIAEFGEDLSEASQGTLMGSLSGTASEMTKAFAELENAKLRGEISDSEYASSKSVLFSKVSELKNHNGSWDAFGENLQETGDKTSGYQEGQAVQSMAAYEARNNGTLNIKMRNGEWVTEYPDPITGRPVAFPPKALGTVDATLINEVFEPDDLIETSIKLGETRKLQQKGSTTLKYDLKDVDGVGSKKTTKGEKFVEGFETREEQEDFYANNNASPLSSIDMYDAGSHIVDNKIRSNINLLEENGDFLNLLNKENFGLTEEQNKVVREKIKEAVKNGGYSRYVKVPGIEKEIDTKSFAIKYTKQDLAKTIVNRISPLEEEVIDKTVDTTTKDGESSFSWGSGSRKDDLNAKYIIDGLLGRGTDKSGEGFLRSVLGTKRGGVQIPRMDKNTNKQAVDPETGELLFTTINKFDKKLETDKKGKKHKYITLTLADGSEQTFDFYRKQDIKELANMLVPTFASGSTNVGNTIKAMDNYLEFLKDERAEREKKKSEKETKEETKEETQEEKEYDTTYAS